ncbi:hypothetical protein [Embleya sp. NPDC059259]|uniref:hypothetical protein n=1 Tax=unclassified Embleya TaxID=2699296 RepID=UPI0036C0420B
MSRDLTTAVDDAAHCPLLTRHEHVDDHGADPRMTRLLPGATMEWRDLFARRSGKAIMSREYHFHCEHAGCSVTVGLRMGRTRELELLVDGKEVAAARVHGHRVQTQVMTAILPTDPPCGIEVEVTLPGALGGDPVSILLADGERKPMPTREVPRRSRPTEASWYS